MKLCAIICEYNPFHNGHAYHIKKSLEISGCDAAICIMNGNFSQRGEATIVDKQVRAKMAIAGGASAVLQIPTYFASTNAEVFALTAVKIAASLKDVTHLSFGSECGDIDSIKELANFLYHEPKFYSEKIKKNLSEGYSLGMSKTKALAESIQQGLVLFSKPKVVMDMLNHPNNILAVEYVRALMKIKNKTITPITVERQTPYSETDIDYDLKLSDATSLRNSVIKTKRVKSLKKYIPLNSFYVLQNHLKETNLPDYELYGKLALYKLRTTSASELKLNYDVVEGIENKLISSARESVGFEQFLELANSRRYSRYRIQRIVLACALNLRAEIVKQIYSLDRLPYVKVIACKNDRNLIASLHNSEDTIVVTRKADALIAHKNDYAKTLMFAEDRAESLYQMLLNLNKFKQGKLADESDIFRKTIFIDD